MRPIIKRSLIVLFTIFGIIGCKKANKIELRSSDLTNNIGYYHNEILKRYYSTAKDNLKSAANFNYQNVEEDAINILVSIDKGRFDRNELESSLRNSDRILDSLGIIQMFNLKSADATNEKNYFTKLVNYLWIHHKISLSLKDSLEEINKLTLQNPMETRKILSKVKSLEYKTWNNKDSEFVSAFTQVYESSYSFWTQKGVGLKSAEEIESESLAIVLADAAGGLYGFLAGPVVSILEGATFSVIAIANYEQ